MVKRNDNNLFNLLKVIKLKYTKKNEYIIILKYN